MESDDSSDDEPLGPLNDEDLQTDEIEIDPTKVSIDDDMGE